MSLRLRWRQLRRTGRGCFVMLKQQDDLKVRIEVLQLQLQEAQLRIDKLRRLPKAKTNPRQPDRKLKLRFTKPKVQIINPEELLNRPDILINKPKVQFINLHELSINPELRFTTP